MLRSRRLALIAATVVLGLSACGTSPSQTTSRTPAVIHVGANARPLPTGGKAGAPAGAPTVDESMMPIQNVTYVFDGTAAGLGTSGAAWTLPAGVTPDLARVAQIAKALGVKGEVRTLPATQGGGWMVGPADYSGPTLTVATDGMLSWWYNPSSTAVAGVGCAIANDTVGGTKGGSSTGGSGGGSGGGTSASTGSAVAPSNSTDVAGTPAPPDAPSSTVVVDPAGPTSVPCEPPAPPAHVPDKAAALAKAKAFFTSLGYDPATLDYQAYADQWGANVTAFVLLGGQRGPLSMNVGFGAEGALTWASGVLGTPQPASDYPLVSVDAALQRLNDHTGKWLRFGGGPGVMYANARGGVAINATDVAVPKVAPPVSAVAAGSSGSGGAAVAPMPPVSVPPVSLPLDTVVVGPIEPTPIGSGPVDTKPAPMPIDTTPVQPITVHLTGVRLSVTSVWADDGTVWLLPAYTFTAADGGEYSVVVVEESFLDLPDPTATVPNSTMPGATTPDSKPLPPATTATGTEPAPVPAPVPVPGGLGTIPPNSTLNPPTSDPGTPGTGASTPGSPGSGSVPPVDGTAPVPTLPAPVDIKDATKQLVGLTLAEGTKVADGLGWTIRVLSTDGGVTFGAVTADYSPTRVDVITDHDVITSVQSIG